MGACAYMLFVNGDVSRDAAWFHPEPEPEEAATQIKRIVAFWT